MRPSKVGSIVTDGDGAKGRVWKVEHVPSMGQGYAARDYVYVQWLIPGDLDPTPSQQKHGY